MIDGKETGVPIEVVYATEGTPVAIGHGAILKNAPNPNAAKLFYQWLYTKEAQQLISDVGGLRSYHPEVKEKEGRTPLKQIKVLYSDPGFDITRLVKERLAAGSTPPPVPAGPPVSGQPVRPQTPPAPPTPPPGPAPAPPLPAPVPGMR